MVSGATVPVGLKNRVSPLLRLVGFPSSRPLRFFRPRDCMLFPALIIILADTPKTTPITQLLFEFVLVDIASEGTQQAVLRRLAQQMAL
mmetsp:Transcript_14745/g.21059  ORF Transcript_14745/g.21059 Transcript_14745/m.21059 type:complete len:89 (+) Transcript_14745:1481-1747(+)